MLVGEVMPSPCGLPRREGQALDSPPGEGSQWPGAVDRRVLPAHPPERAHASPLPRRRPARAGEGRPLERLPLLHRRPDPHGTGHPPAAGTGGPPRRRPAHLALPGSGSAGRTRRRPPAAARVTARPDPRRGGIAATTAPARTGRPATSSCGWCRPPRWPPSRTTSIGTMSSTGTPARWPNWTPWCPCARAIRAGSTTMRSSRPAADTCWCTGRRSTHPASAGSTP